MIGVVYSTCDRPVYLSSSIKSLDCDCSKVVVVDNGTTKKEETFKAVKNLGAIYVDGKQSNSPHAQNIGFRLLKDKVQFILKSDDDVDYSVGYVSNLMDVLLNDSDVCAVAGITLSKFRTTPARYENGEWVCEGKSVDEQLLLYPLFSHKNLEVYSLHGGFIYRVSSAINLWEKTSFRGGPFGEYFSKYAFREESEFSFLLSMINKQKLIVVPKSGAYHYYAEGGIRDLADSVRLMKEDENRVKDVCESLGFTFTTAIFKRFYDELPNYTK